MTAVKKVIATGVQDFESLRADNRFYVDKTNFIQEWWNGGDAVTLITRPRRFGKTLNLSMLNCFFSKEYENRGDLFEGLKVWKDPDLRKEQGVWPVIFLTFAGIKGTSCQSTKVQIKKMLVRLALSYPELLRSEKLEGRERLALDQIRETMSDDDAALSLNLLSTLLEKEYGKKVLIFLDEYDTPLQEAYINGYWKELAAFTRTMFNNTFKTNASLARAVMTGITRVSKESIFSELNNLDVVTTTSDKYATCFGFTEPEVFQALDEQGFTEKNKVEVKAWYDGFTFGSCTDIYNPWSVTNYLDKGKLGAYWANTSGNGLVGMLIRQGDPKIKMQFETLLAGNTLTVPIDEQIIFEQLDILENAIWSLLLASGYLKVVSVGHQIEENEEDDTNLYTLAITNREVRMMFRSMIRSWFEEGKYFGEFITSMFRGNELDMNRYMNRIAMHIFSYFDTGKGPGGSEPEKFYHGFVLGLLVDQAANYELKSNRESGFGRYDVMLVPRKLTDTAVILEFKVLDGDDGESTLEDTAANALKQIEEKKYETELLARGIPEENILKYGFAFKGKECLIRKG